MKKIKENLKYIKIKDILSIFVFIIAIPFAVIIKIKNKIKKQELWLISESKEAARDNGYHLFKYIRENYPDRKCFYAINRKCSDYNKIKKYNNIIQYESLKHWIYYLAADKNICTQKDGNPNPALFYILHVYGILRSKRIFLQHGITKDNLPYINYKNAKFSLFICGAKKEYEFVRDTFGYPDGYVKYTGLARFDNLYENDVDKKQILIMPTWRSWLGRDLNKISKCEDFTKTMYSNKWNNLLKNEKFNNFLDENNIKVYFYPHIHMQKYLKYFKVNSKNIKVVDNSDIDIQDLLKRSALLITDYSSVFMDFAYMNKPVIYYQFDEQEFRARHLTEGYFRYNRDGFGDVLTNEDDVVDKIINYIKTNYKVEEKYMKRMKDFFEIRDKNNCERIYKEIEKL